MVPINFKTYYYDLNLANSQNKITWKRLHDFRTYYGLKDLRPDQLSGFAERIMNDEAYALMYEWNKGRQAPGQRPLKCDD